jgi:prophage regulatory protein
MSEKPERFLRLAQVRSRVPYSRSTIYNLMAQRKFPQPFSLGGRAVAWLESDIDRWIASRIENKRAGVSA